MEILLKDKISARITLDQLNYVKQRNEKQVWDKGIKRRTAVENSLKRLAAEFKTGFNLESIKER